MSTISTTRRPRSTPARCAAGAFVVALLSGPTHPGAVGAADLAQNPALDPAGVDPTELLALLRAHRIGPTVHALLPADDPAFSALRRAAAQTLLPQAARRLAVTADLRLLAEALPHDDCRWAVVKGPAIATRYPDPARREFHDLDVLVDGRDLGPALLALESAGARILEDDFDAVLARGQGEIALELPHGTFLDLHWHLVNRPERRAAFRLDVTGMLRRRRATTLLGTPCWVLDPVDELHHLALHATLSGGWRLLWSYDLKLALARAGSSDLDLLRRRSRTAGTALAVAVALTRARDVLGVPVPERLLRDLSAEGPLWVAGSRLLTRTRPPQQLDGPEGSGRRVLASTRCSTAGGVRALLSARRAPRRGDGRAGRPGYLDLAATSSA